MADDSLDYLRRSILAGDIPLDETDDGRSFTLTQRAEDPYDPLKFRRYDPSRKFRPEAEINKLDLPESLGELTSDIIQKKATSTLSPADWMRWLASKIPSFNEDREDPTGVEGKGGGAHTPGLVDALLAHTSRPGMPKKNAAVQGELPAAPQSWGELGTSFVKHAADTPGQMLKALLQGGAGWLDYQQHRGPGDFSPNSIMLGPDSAVLPLKLLTKGVVRRGEASPTSSFDSLRAKYDQAWNGPQWRAAEPGGLEHGLGAEGQAVVGDGHPGIPGKHPQIANPFSTLRKMALERNNISKQLPGEQHAYPDDMPGAANEGGSSIRDRFRDPNTDNTFPRTPSDRSLFAQAGDERLATLAARQAEEAPRPANKVADQLKRLLEERGVNVADRMASTGTRYLTTSVGKPKIKFRVPDPSSELGDHPGERRMVPHKGEWIREPIIDTAEPYSRPENADSNFNTTNRGGRPYSPFKGSRDLQDAVSWVTTDRLVPEDAAPNFARYRPDEPAPRPSMAEGADFHPDQLKLLAKGGNDKLGVLAGQKRAPAVWTEPPKLFDLSRKKMEQFADIPHKPFETPEWRKGMPEYVQEQDLLGKDNMKRMQQGVDRGIKIGGLGWYNLGQWRDMFVGELGKTKGTERFNRLMEHIAATSPRNPVPTNIPTGIYHNWRELNGMAPLKVGDKPPSGYGSLAQRLHNQLVADLREKGWFDPMKNPKPPSFGQNLKGDIWGPEGKPYEGHVAADQHAAVSAGLLDTMGRPQPVPGNAYNLVKRVYQMLGKKNKIAAAQAQSADWVGVEEGRKSPPEPFLQTVQARAYRTAKKEGISPELAMRRVIKGEGLLAKGGDKRISALIGKSRDRLKAEEAYDAGPYDFPVNDAGHLRDVPFSSDRTAPKLPKKADGRTIDPVAAKRALDYGNAWRDPRHDNPPVLPDDVPGQSRADRLKQGKENMAAIGPNTPSNVKEWMQGGEHRNLEGLKRYAGGLRDFAQMERPEDTPLSKLNAKAGDSNLQAILAGLDARKVKKAVDATQGVSYGNRQTMMEKQFGVSRQHGEWWKDYLAKQGINPDAGPRAMIEKAIEKNRQDWKHGKGMTEVTGAPDFRERLAAAVDKHGGNQRKIAEELGVSQATASRWMRAPEGGKITGDNPRPPGLPAAKHGGWAVTKEPDGRAGNGGKQPYWQKDEGFAGQVKDLHSQGLGVNEIAKRTGRNVRTITNAMEGLGLEQNTAHGGDRTSGKETTLSARADDPGFIKAFWASYDKHNPKGGRDGDWASKVAGELGISRQIVYRYADKLPRNAEAGAEQASQRRALDMEERYNQPERHVSQTESGRSNDHWDYVRGKAEEAAQREQETQAKGVDQAMARRTKDASGKPKPLDNEDGGRSRAEREQGDLAAVQRLIKEKKLKAEGGDEKTAAVAGQSQVDKIRQEARAKKLAERYQETDASREEQSQANRMANAERNLGRTEQDTARSAKDESDADWAAAKKAAAEHRGKAKEAKAATGSRYLALLGGTHSDDKRGLIMRAIGGRQKRLDK